MDDVASIAKDEIKKEDIEKGVKENIQIRVSLITDHANYLSYDFCF